jgi:hypothetical protein
MSYLVRNSMLSWLALLALAGIVSGCGSSKENEPHREENLTALAARQGAQEYLRSLGSQGDLIMVIPGEVVTWKRSDGYLYYTVPAWDFNFRDPANLTKITSVEVRINRGQEGELTTHSNVIDFNFSKELAIAFEPIVDWKIDSDQAENFARNEPWFPGGIFMLKMRKVDRKSVPVWVLPYRYFDKVVRGIRADNGKFVYLTEEEDTWTSIKPTDWH